MLTLSIVSHRQGALVAELLRDIESYCAQSSLRVILTLNVEEPLAFRSEDFSFQLDIIKNRACRGFGANHNEAFGRSCSDQFCVLNPDIRLNANPFPTLLAELKRANVAVVAPAVMSSSGSIEDSARKYPTFISLMRTPLLGGRPSDYVIEGEPFSPDWVAGMFMLFRSSEFARVSGFDERYFMYYEDVDICARLRRLGGDVRLVPAVRVVHHARRTSHRNPRYLRWHLASMSRFLWRRALGRI